MKQAIFFEEYLVNNQGNHENQTEEHIGEDMSVGGGVSKLVSKLRFIPMRAVETNKDFQPRSRPN